MSSQPRADPGVRRILCATDGSPQARIAASHGIALARACQAELLVVYVVLVDYHTGIHLGEEFREEEAAARLAVAQILEDAAAQGITARAVLARGRPGPGILETAESEGADLIVVGRKGQGFLERVFLGSVASYVAEKSSIAVLLVPVDDAPLAEPPA